MIVKDLKFNLLKVLKKEGNGKQSNKPYKFYVASLVDEDSNVFGYNLADDFIKGLSESDLSKLMEMKNVPINGLVKFTPKGFDVSGTLLDFDVVK